VARHWRRNAVGRRHAELEEQDDVVEDFLLGQSKGAVSTQCNDFCDTHFFVVVAVVVVVVSSLGIGPIRIRQGLAKLANLFFRSWQF
jgi:hypothetical protein